MPKGETGLNFKPYVSSAEDESRKVKKAHEDGLKAGHKKEDIFGELGTTHYAGKVAEMNWRLGQVRKKHQENKAEEDKRIRNEKMTEKVRKAIKEMRTPQAKKEEIIDGVLINDTPPPLPRTQADTRISPADTKLAALAARTDATPKPTSMWGKFKSFFTTNRDERASAKFSTMQADSGETSADRRVARQGEAMMAKQDRELFKTEMKKTKNEMEDEEILAKEGPKWSAEAERMMKEPPESPKKEALQFKSAYRDKKTAAEQITTELASEKLGVKFDEPQTQAEIQKRVGKEQTRVDKLVADYEEGLNKFVTKDADLEDWTMADDSPAQSGGEDKLTEMAVGGAFRRGIDQGIDKIQSRADGLFKTRLDKKADRLSDLDVGLRDGKQLLKEQRDLKAGERMQDMAEGRVMDSREFKQRMRAGKHQAELDRLEEQMTSKPLPGKYENANLDKLNRVDDEINNLRGIIESIKFGGLFGSFKTKLKTNKEGHITNLPGGDEDMVIDDLVKQKEKLGSKGKVEAANQIIDQIETLKKYTDLLVERDKLMAGNK